MESEIGNLETLALGFLSDVPNVLNYRSVATLSPEASGSSGASALVKRLSPAALAYLGDAVYEMYVRTLYLAPPKRLQDYHKQVVSHVRAESQAQHLQSLQPYLTDAELEVVRRGRNATPKKPKRLDAETYQQATSLETLVGYLYITDPERLLYLLTQIKFDLLPKSADESTCSDS
ncbi:MAG TPA: ribonuclease III domain-containing protein [Allocoleopsis sp.]